MYHNNLKTSSKKSQAGYTIIEMIAMTVVLAILFTIVIVILVNILRLRTRSSLNSQTRNTANEVMTILIKNIKDSRDIYFNDTIPQTTQIGCWYYTPTTGNICQNDSLPYCSFSQISLNVDDSLNRTYFLDTPNKRILVKDRNIDTGTEKIYPISPSSLKIQKLSFIINPRLCFAYAGSSVTYVNYEQPVDNIVIKANLEVESPLTINPNAQAYTQAFINIESSASFRAYHRFQSS